MPSFDRLPQVAVGGGDDAHVHLNFLHSAQVHEALVLQHAQQLGLRLHRHVADFVEEDRAAVGHLEQALLAADRAGEGALDVAEEGGLQQVARHGAGVDRHKGAVLARRVGVNRLCDQLLAGAAFALQQDGGARGRDLRHQVEGAQHQLAFADDVFKVVALLELALELDVLLFHALASDGGAHVGLQLFVGPRLGDEVGRASLDGGYRVFRGAIGGDHDDRHLRIALANLLQNLQSIAVGELKVEQDQIERLRVQQAQALFAILGVQHLVAVVFQQQSAAIRGSPLRRR